MNHMGVQTRSNMKLQSHKVYLVFTKTPVVNIDGLGHKLLVLWRTVKLWLSKCAQEHSERLDSRAMQFIDILQILRECAGMSLVWMIQMLYEHKHTARKRTLQLSYLCGNAPSKEVALGFPVSIGQFSTFMHLSHGSHSWERPRIVVSRLMFFQHSETSLNLEAFTTSPLRNIADRRILCRFCTKSPVNGWHCHEQHTLHIYPTQLLQLTHNWPGEDILINIYMYVCLQKLRSLRPWLVTGLSRI